MQQLEAEHGERTQRGYEIDARARGRTATASNQIAMEIDRAHARRQHERRALRGTGGPLRASEAELAQARQRLTASKRSVSRTGRFSNRPLRMWLPRSRSLALCQQEAAAAADRIWPQLERQQEASRVAMMEAWQRPPSLRNQLAQAEERLAAWIARRSGLQAEIATATSQVEAFGGQRGQLALEFETVSQRVSGLTEEILQLRHDLE